MVTENNSQINTFVKGMNSDTSYSMLQEGQYVYADNLRIFQVDDNNQNGQGEVRVIEGIRLALAPQSLDVDRILAATSIRDIGIIIVRHKSEPGKEEDGGKWSVYKFSNAIGKDENHTSDTFNSIKDFQTVFKSQDKTTKDNFDVVCRYEDDDNIKVYIADGEHPLLVLNLNDKFEGYEQPINNVSSHPTLKLFPAKVVSVISGNLKSGMVSYAYRLYSKYGQASEMSPATRMYPVVNKKGYIYEGGDYDKNTNCGFKIQINVEDAIESVPALNHMEVYRIAYHVTGQLPSVELIGNIKISKTDTIVTFNDYGNIPLKSLSLEEFNTISGIHIIPEVIESKNDYMFAAKIKSENQAYQDKNILDWDSRSYSFDEEGVCNLYDYTNTDYPKYSFTRVEGILKDIPKDFDCFDVNNIMTKSYTKRTDINGKYGGTGINVDWQFVREKILLDNSVNGDDGKIVLAKGFGDPFMASEKKSLRRGELYRYGIILYTNNGSHSDVKWIADIRVPEVYEKGFYPFEVENEKLYGVSLGIKFNVRNLPDSVTSYEIVRCNRTQDDIKTITQGVISRPIQFLDNTTLVSTGNDTTGPGPQSKLYPLMPTGYISTAWWYTGVGNAYRAQNVNDTLVDAYDIASPQYRNTVDDKLYPSCDNFENIDTYQFISAESTYLKDSTINLIDDNSYVKLCRYLFPSVNRNMHWVIMYKKSNEYTYSTSHHSYQIPIGKNSQLPLYYNSIGSDCDINKGIDWKSVPDIWKYLYIASYNPSIYATIYDEGKEDEIKIGDGEWIKKVIDAYSYCKLYENDNTVIEATQSIRGRIELDISNTEQTDIKAIKIAKEGGWNKLCDIGSDGNIVTKYDGDTISVGTSTYNNWVLGTLYGVDGNSSEFPMKKANYNLLNNTRDDTLAASGGRCYVMQLDIKKENLFHPITNVLGVTTNHKGIYNHEDHTLPAESNRIIPCSIVGTYLCNIQHDITPYGSGSYASLETSSYYSYGDFFDAKDNDITIFDGDCYPTILEYVSAHKVYGSENQSEKQFCTSSIIYSIPLESNINTFLTNGFEFSRNADVKNVSSLQIEPSQVSSYFTQSEELYRYNSVYSSYSTHNPYVSESDEVKYNQNNDCRVYFSEMKSNNENIDNWTIFKSSNYIDVDSRYGAITAIEDFKNILFFWQEHATGRIASKERSVVSDINNIQLALGTGDILERYDYIDYIHGMYKDQFCLAKSNEALYWFDEHNQAIRCTADGQSVVDLSMQYGVNNYMHKYEQKNKNPKLFFDKKYGELVSSVVEDKSIVYNQNYKAFTSFTDTPFDASISFNNGEYLIRTKDGGIEIAQWNCKQSKPTGWDNKTLPVALRYVVNKQPIVTKVFDDQEIVTTNKPYSENKLNKYMYEKLRYTWNTDINSASSTLVDKITDREGNFRYAIPRAGNADYGNRIRGKYMICQLEGESNYNLSIQYILTKFRTSWS